MNLEPIDTSTTAGKAEVMRLAAEGRKVVCRADFHDQWAEEDSEAWNWSDFYYAIIAEQVGPEEVWFTVINGNVDAGPYTYECAAVDRAQNYGGISVRYRRVEE